MVMKKLSLIMLLCVALASCKSIRSHVQKSYADSLYKNREISNADLMAVSARVITTKILTDSNTNQVIRLDSFSGVITPIKIEGKAHRVDILGTVNLKRVSDSQNSEIDSLIFQGRSESVTDSKIELKITDKQKETKGGRPWWIWPMGIVAIILGAAYLIIKVKSKLKLF